ncbi:MAG: hypothetical protein WCW44_02170 [archaeon]|jgi:hypothetical protein
MSAPWDFLREGVNFVGVIEPLTLWVLLIVSIAMAGIAVLALKKKSSPKLKWVAGAFGLFFVKSALLVTDYYFSPGDFMNKSIVGFLDLCIMLAFFVALFRK